MKVIDCVKKSFFKYPSLYAHRDFNKIKFSFLEHCFIVSGNGYDWANTKNPKKGGYLTELSYHNNKIVYSLDYGKEKVDIDITPYLSAEKIYELEEIDHKATKDVEKLFNSIGVKEFPIRGLIGYEKDKSIQKLWLKEDFSKLPNRTLMPDSQYNESYKYFLREFEFKEGIKDSPYPNFSKNRGCFWKDGSEYIQEDWKIEGINHLSYWKEYFNDTERVKSYSSYPKYDETEDQKMLDILKSQIKQGQKLEAVLKNYGYKLFDLNDKDAYREAIKERWDTDYKNILEFIDETIYKLLKTC